MHSGEIVAIVELAVYIPTFVLTVITIIRHGFHRQLGWIFLSVFCTVRTVGAIFTILSQNNPTDTTDLEWSGILQSVGLSPLLLASLGLLKRVIDMTSDRLPTDPNSRNKQILQLLSAKFGIVKRLAGPATATARRSRVIQLLHLPATIALILCIIGGLDEASSSPDDQKDGPKLFKAGIIMFTIIYAMLVMLALSSFSEMRKTPTKERRVLIAVLLALPLLALRLLWALLSIFVNNATFNISGGSVVAEVVMATIEEFCIVIIFVIAGFLVERYNPNESGPASKLMTSSSTPLQPVQPTYHRTPV